MSSVRPVGLPCRPLKLRFDDDAQTSRPSRRSGFIAEAHRAAGVAPLEAGVDEDAVEPFALRGARDRLRPGHDQRLHVRRDVVAANDARGFAQVREPAVGARTDERDVDPRAVDAAAGAGSP